VGWEAGNRQKRKKRFPWNFLARMLPVDIEDPRIRFVRHHIGHGIASFFPSGFAQANVLSLDAYGGSESGILGLGDGADFRILKTVPTKGSWGWVYSEITKALGFRFHSDEGKVMGLAAYGEPDLNSVDFVDWDRPIPLIDRAKFRRYLENLPLRRKGEDLTDRHRNIAATAQAVLERGALKMAEFLHSVSGFTRLCVSGGCALNCAMNGALLDADFVEELYVNPAPHDLSSALGAALWIHREATGERTAWRLRHAGFGPAFSNDEVKAALDRVGAGSYRRCDDIAAEAAERIARGEIVAWFQGRSEFGPRALGARSILADPRDKEILDRVNRLKGRELWRPLAPSIRREDLDTFVTRPAPSPFMHIAFEATDEAKRKIPAVIHTDGTLRVQTVEAEDQERFHRLITRFGETAGVGAVLNTSFNLSRQPMVLTPQDALGTFFSSGLDALALEDYIVWKETRS
jgi:carbamoyltransferase